MRENEPFNGIPDVMQAIASSDIEINEVRPQHSKLVGGKVRERNWFWSDIAGGMCVAVFKRLA